MIFYQEPNGDFLMVNPDHDEYYRKIGQPEIHWARTTAVAGNRKSICTGEVHTDHLKDCRQIEQDEVPAEWLDIIGLPLAEGEGE